MTQSETWLVTGATGCIGAWVAVGLVRDGVKVIALDHSTDPYRRRLIATEEELAHLTVVHGDITDLDGIERVMSEHAVTHVVHLAAMQAPLCREDPPRGALVNVAGTVNVFEAARRHGIEQPIVYASSAGVYDEHGDHLPHTIYGVYKLANEGTARIYWHDHAVASVGLRPNVAYGAGRDRGMTSGPTAAIVAAVRGEPFHIPFGGSTQLQYVRDVAAAFIAAARSEAEGASVFNLGGPASAIADVVTAIEAAIPGARITFDDIPLPFPSSLPEPWFGMPTTSLEQGVAETIELVGRAG